MTTIDVYAARIPFDIENTKIAPELRAKDIQSCSNGGVRERKFYAWKLLELALRRSFGLKIEELEFTNENGKWRCGECEFSLSHSGNAVAVAVSQKPVGVDIELCNAARLEKLAARILTEKEREACAGNISGERLNVLWTVKEAAFKCGSGKAFIPNEIETEGLNFVTKTVMAGGDKYFLTVVAPQAQTAVFNPINVIIE